MDLTNDGKEDPCINFRSQATGSDIHKYVNCNQQPSSTLCMVVGLAWQLNNKWVYILQTDGRHEETRAELCRIYEILVGYLTDRSNTDKFSRAAPTALQTRQGSLPEKSSPFQLVATQDKFGIELPHNHS